MNATHAPNMAHKVTLFNKISQRGLIQVRRAKIHDLPGYAKRPDQSFRQNQVTDAKCREHHFAESADVQYLFSGIQSL
jgi:hypothetical protein